jgi:hypothetical protein
LSCAKGSKGKKIYYLGKYRDTAIVGPEREGASTSDIHGAQVLTIHFFSSRTGILTRQMTLGWRMNNGGNNRNLVCTRIGIQINAVLYFAL